MDISTTDNSGTGINRSVNMRAINTTFTKLFKRYSAALGKATGGELFGNTQTKQIQDSAGVAVEYDRGKIVFKHGIDKLKFLLENKDIVADVLGTTPEEIASNRRNWAKMHEYLTKLDARYDIGDLDSNMQMYISKHDNNSAGLDSTVDWVDYILTQTWIDQLADHTVKKSVESEQQLVADHRIEYLSDMVQGMMSDHEIDYHDNLDTFDADQFVDRVNFKEVEPGEVDQKEPETNRDKFMDAINKLNTFRQLNYGFYEIFKPLGGTNEKYIKLKASTNGELDITGVVGLEDCEEVDWEYGSREYLRSLNTGNRRFDFKLSRGFNDSNSYLWFKLDEKEELKVDKEDEGSVLAPTGYKYYAPYETERFLRWFGTNYFPLIDIDSIIKKTVCSTPVLKSDLITNRYYSDATNIVTMNPLGATTNINSSTTLSLLSLQPKSTIDVINKADGQYIRFIVSGNQQTHALSFHVTGKMYNTIQEINHYANTRDLLVNAYRKLTSELMFFQVTQVLNPTIEEVWNILFKNEKWIPQTWTTVHSQIESLQKPNSIDLLRARQIDIERVVDTIMKEMSARREFIMGINGKDADEKEYIYKLAEDNEDVYVDGAVVEEIIDKTHNRNFYCSNLDLYIHHFNESEMADQLNKWYIGIPLENETKDTLIRSRLRDLYHVDVSDEELAELEKYEIQFGVPGYDELETDEEKDAAAASLISEIRSQIETYNNLVKSLPTNTYSNKITSRHIFLDWKRYVDETLDWLVERGKLRTMRKHGIGSDGLEKVYFEYYTDFYRTPLVDYSYLYDEDGNPILDLETKNPIGDRWDYWTEDDFM